ncbi:hypothetical protein ACXGQW_06800 [Wenyingzhuangia sp. IMCC45533]
MKYLLKNLSFLLFFLLFACKDDKIETPSSLAREGRVNQIVTDKTLVNVPGTFTILTNQGTRGVIVYNTGATGVLQYRAFDLSCPYISPTACSSPMSVDNSGTLSCADCADDDITFDEFKTSVTVDGETYNLIEYEASLVSTGVRIRNFTR